ncbi:MAG: hypothetical protein M1826_005844 [Phylliscum demangeonii]|nr:MAG: hypothetical protein M1826_005844 [Phylliscum demangeonii]
MLRRKPTVITLTMEDVSLYDDRLTVLLAAKEAAAAKASADAQHAGVMFGPTPEAIEATQLYQQQQEPQSQQLQELQQSQQRGTLRDIREHPDRDPGDGEAAVNAPPTGRPVTGAEGAVVGGGADAGAGRGAARTQNERIGVTERR